ncbi:MAG TPA: hypothetical protein PLK75_08345 [Bacteroidales bacterium]|nr:hypothetical protein [Bacteroidales bacterium]
MLELLDHSNYKLTDSMKEYYFKKRVISIKLIILLTVIGKICFSQEQITETVLSGHTDIVNTICYSPDGKLLASGSNDKTIRIWDVNSGKCIKTLRKHNLKAVNSVSFSPDGKFIASASNSRTVKLWDLQEEKNTKNLYRHKKKPVYSIVFSNDGNSILSRSSNSIILWDIKNDVAIKKIIEISEFSDKIIDLCRDGRFFAYYTDGNYIIIMKRVNNNFSQAFNIDDSNRYAGTLDISSNGDYVAYVDRNNNIKIRDINNNPIITLSEKTIADNNINNETEDYINSICFSPDGNSIVSSGSKETKIYVVNSGDCIKTIPKSLKYVRFSPDSMHIACVYDKDVYIYKVFFRDKICVDGNCGKYFGQEINGKANGYGKIFYDNGATYVGYFLDNKRQGNGQFLDSVGNRYTGNWAVNRRNGYGIQIFFSTQGKYDGFWIDDERSGRGLMFDNQGKYDGLWKQNLRNGQGKMTYKDGGIYDGEWMNDKRHGQGTMLYASGDKYEGNWINDDYGIEGKITYKDGTFYNGELKSNRYDGLGKIIYPNGEAYDGEWKDGKKSGKGVMNYANGDVYTGEWLDNRRNGFGLHKYNKSNQTFEGNWIDDQIANGLGTYTWPDGQKYVGEFNNGTFDGQGIRTYSDGSTYEGTWKKGIREGNGTMIYANGDKYVGDWKSDMRNGFGVHSYNQSKQIYEGNWVDDYVTGQGTYTWPDGQKYVGEFSKGVAHGKGKRTYADGSSYDGNWEKDTREGKGTMIYANRDKYEGDWVNDIRSGYGTIWYANGKKYTGEWLDDKEYADLAINDSEDGKYISVELASGGKCTVWCDINCENRSYFIKEMECKEGYADGWCSFITSTLDGKPICGYMGYMQHGKKHGMGREIFILENVEYFYEGDWKFNKKDGLGELNLPDLHYYGSFKNDKFDGKGRLYFKKGGVEVARYIGNFSNDLPNGQGAYYGEDGNIYEGNWENGEKNGQGKMTFTDGTIYEGELKEGSLTGFGAFTYSNGSKYEGYYIEGVISESVVITMPNGDIIKGPVKNGELDGNVTIYYKNGTTSYAKFSNGEIVSSSSTTSKTSNSVGSPCIIKIDENYDTKEIGYYKLKIIKVKCNDNGYELDYLLYNYPKRDNSHEEGWYEYNNSLFFNDDCLYTEDFSEAVNKVCHCK